MSKGIKNANREALVKTLINEYAPQNVMELQDILKEIFAPLMEEMLQAELESELGYSKHDQTPKATRNRRNGSYPKTVRSKLGEVYPQTKTFAKTFPK